MIAIPEVSEAQKKAQKTYMSKLGRIGLTMSPEKKQRVQDHASSRGESVNEFVNRAIDETIENDAPGE